MYEVFQQANSEPEDTQSGLVKLLKAYRTETGEKANDATEFVTWCDKYLASEKTKPTSSAYAKTQGVIVKLADGTQLSFGNFDSQIIGTKVFAVSGS